MTETVTTGAADVPATKEPTVASVQAEVAALQGRLDTVAAALGAVEKLSEAVDKLSKQPVAVPTTDGGSRPTITPTVPDFTQLPPIARIAAGYR